MTEERAKAIVDEVTIALDTAERFVRVEDSLPFGAHMMPQQDPISKLEALRVRRSWLETVDEAEFRFAVAHQLVLQRKSAPRPDASTTHTLLVFIAAAPILCLIFALDRLPERWHALASMAVALNFCFCVFVMCRLAWSSLKGMGFRDALEITRDYDAARRYVLDETRHQHARFKPSAIQTQKVLATLDEAARSLNLL